MVCKLNHQAAGVRKAAIQALPVSRPAVAEALLASGVLNDPNKLVRLAACLALMEAASTLEIGTAIFRAADQSENANDKWIAKALELLARIHYGVISKEYATHLDSVSMVPFASDSPFVQQLMAGKGQRVPEGRTPTAADEVIQLRAQLGKLLYDKPSIVVKARSTVTIIFSNPNYMQHNLVIATPMVDPNHRIDIRCAIHTGQLSFFCTFPGQGETMYGTMEVVAE